MSSVITLIAARRDLQNEFSFYKQFSALDIVVRSHRWLSVNTALDLYCELPAPDLFASVDRRLSGLFFDQKIDWVVQPAESRRKKMLITDMDSTIIQNECIDELADVVGLKDKVSAITSAAMNGQLDFRAALRERVALLKGLPLEELQDVYDSRIKLMSGAKELLATMRAGGALCVLVSGGFTFFTSKIAQLLGFQFHHACELETVDGRLTGNLAGEIVDKNLKLHFLKHHSEKRRMDMNDILAIGDGANDIPMLEAAGLALAYHAKEKVNAVINNRIRFTDLRSALYTQGYSDEEILSQFN